MCTITCWEEILQSQLDRIYNSGLYDGCTAIFLGVLGDGDIAPFVLAYPKLEILFQDPDIKLFERPTLLALHNYCTTHPNARVLYLHTKGVQRNRNPNVTDWTKYMEYFTIDCWHKCLLKLNKYDACGVNWRLQPLPHFSGNFWWARAKYISRLPPQIELVDHLNSKKWKGLDPYYLAPEMWIGLRSPKVKCFHESYINHYDSPYPELYYKK